jgi:APA family basic amino acid/polyamine antiporter
MYGDFTAFIFGWATLAIMQSGSQAAIAYVCSEYLGYYFHWPHFSKEIENIGLYLPFIGDIYPLKEFGTKIVAMLCILFLTSVNYIGVLFGGAVQTFVTILKILSILLLTALIFIFGHGSTMNFFTSGALTSGCPSNLFAAFGLATAGAFWAYDGWNNVTYVAGEVVNPKKNVPLALLIGTVSVIIVYVLINLAFLYILPIGVIAKSPLVAATAAQVIFGPVGASLISAAVIISTFGALNGNILATPRVLYAMSENNSFFRSMAKIHPKYKTPHVALMVLCIWSLFLVLTGSFDIITDYVIFAEWLFYALGAYGVFVLRKKMPDTFRPYKVWGYPYLPVIFILFSVLFLLNTLIVDTQKAMMGIVLISLGIPFYFYCKIKKPG